MARYQTTLLAEIAVFWFMLMLVLTSTSCTTSAPTVTVINGRTVVQKDKKFMGIPVATVEEEVKTKEQKLDDLEVKKAAEQQELDLQTEKRQSAAAFWIGMGLLAFAPVCVIIGYIANGWKFWGTMGALSGALGAAFWSFEHLIPFLKWPAFALGAMIVLWTMYKFKDFSLLDRLKNSEPGAIIRKPS